MGSVTVRGPGLGDDFFRRQGELWKKERKDNPLELGASLSPFPEEGYKTGCHGYPFKR